MGTIAYYPFEKAVKLATSRAKYTGTPKFLYLCKSGSTIGLFYIKSDPWRTHTSVIPTHKVDKNGTVYEITK